jgi:hypothetical protein
VSIQLCATGIHLQLSDRLEERLADCHEGGIGDQVVDGSASELCRLLGSSLRNYRSIHSHTSVEPAFRALQDVKPYLQGVIGHEITSKDVDLAREVLELLGNLLLSGLLVSGKSDDSVALLTGQVADKLELKLRA